MVIRDAGRPINKHCSHVIGRVIHIGILIVNRRVHICIIIFIESIVDVIKTVQYIIHISACTVPGIRITDKISSDTCQQSICRRACQSLSGLCVCKTGNVCHVSAHADSGRRSVRRVCQCPVILIYIFRHRLKYCAEVIFFVKRRKYNDHIH